VSVGSMPGSTLPWMVLALAAREATAWLASGANPAATSRCPRVAAVHLSTAFPDDSDDAEGADESSDGGEVEGERVGDDERSEVDDFRAQLLRQFLGGDDSADEPNAVDVLLKKAGVPVAPPVTRASQLAAGQMLVANPERFCSRNPFSRPVRDLGRFGLQGPLDLSQLEPDDAAQMLPVLFLTEHSTSGSRALLMERRTGALMGDVNMEDYGCVAIAPLWLGGTAKQSNLYVVHDVDNIDGATEVSRGVYLGGWAAARPKVADSSLAEGRFKFFLGSTEWAEGQLEEEFKQDAWIALQCEPSVVLKDRVAGWQPGRQKPVWRELLKYLGDEAGKIIRQVYPQED